LKGDGIGWGYQVKVLVNLIGMYCPFDEKLNIQITISTMISMESNPIRRGLSSPILDGVSRTTYLKVLTITDEINFLEECISTFLRNAHFKHPKPKRNENSDF